MFPGIDVYVLLPRRLMNIAVPVSFFQRDRALGSGRIRAAAMEGLAVSAGWAAGAAWLLPSSFSLAAAAAAKTTAAKLEPELIEGPAGTPKVFNAARGISGT